MKLYGVTVTMTFGVEAQNEEQANDRAEEVITSLLSGKGQPQKKWYDDTNFGYEIELTEEE